MLFVFAVRRMKWHTALLYLAVMAQGCFAPDNFDVFTFEQERIPDRTACASRKRASGLNFLEKEVEGWDVCVIE